MPDIDYLMQEWPPEVEEMLRHNSSGLPTADFDCEITTYVDIICSLLDIPVSNPVPRICVTSFFRTQYYATSD